MTTRRLLGETLIDVASGAFEAAAATSVVSVRQLTLTLPIEFGLQQSGSVCELLGDVPRTVTRTAFDLTPGRLEVTWLAEGT